jgi:hypothetical protein
MSEIGQVFDLVLSFTRTAVRFKFTCSLPVTKTTTIYESRAVRLVFTLQLKEKTIAKTSRAIQLCFESEDDFTPFLVHFSKVLVAVNSP